MPSARFAPGSSWSHAVRELGTQVDSPDLQLRAGVTTGEAAVTIGATGQGMVAGDLVNTASRLQSAAPPGTVLVGEANDARRVGGDRLRAGRRAGAQGQGAAGPRVARGPRRRACAAARTAARRSSRRSSAATPSCGLLKELLHATARERRARLVSVIGVAGIGKSRLAWEFQKYIDGVVEDIYWHQGRSPAYGEGITFWALGEMVRKRAGLAETDDAATTRERIAATVAEYVPDEEERRWIEPRLLQLLGRRGGPRRRARGAVRGVADVLRARRGQGHRRSSSSRTSSGPTRACSTSSTTCSSGAARHPILVVTLARPELLERRPDWGAGRRNFVSLSLEPLRDEAMREGCSTGLVPGLPDAAVRPIVERADGIPLYAVETVRMLLARGRARCRATAPTGRSATCPSSRSPRRCTR